MTITIEVPDSLAKQLTAAGKDPARALLEAYALNEYQAGDLTEAEIRELLAFDTRMEVHGFLKEHGVSAPYSTGDLDRDRAAAQPRE